jgi:DNA-binding MarR family transcriptional regulator
MTPTKSSPQSVPSDASALPPMRLPDVYAAPGHLIRRAQQIAVAIFFDEFRGWEVTPVQYAALVAIRDRPGMDQRTLVSCVAIDRSTLGSMLRVLDERGFISRVTPKENQRIKRLYIQPAGEELLDSTRDAIQRVQERILAPLSRKERDVFLQNLARIVDINNGLSRAPLRIAGAKLEPATG